MTTEKNLADVASRVVSAVENVAPKTLELLVRAEFLDGVTLTLIFGLLSMVGFGLARFLGRRRPASTSYYDATDYKAGAAVGWFVGVASLAVAFSLGLPSVIDPEAVAVAKLVHGLLRVDGLLQ